MVSKVHFSDLTADIAIIAAMNQELEVLETALVDKHSFSHLGKVFYTGILEGVSVVLTLSGIGKVNAAAATMLTLALFSPKAVINTGSAGGLASEVEIGDVVLGRVVAHHDVDVRAFGYVIGQVPQLPPLFESDAGLLTLAEAAARTFSDTTVHQGLVISGDQFINGGQKLQVIREHFPQVQACEMEAAAIAQVCQQAAVPFVIIRAISDHADYQAEQSFEAFLIWAAKRSAMMVQRLVHSWAKIS